MNQVKDSNSIQSPKIFVVCNLCDTVPVWAYILRQQGLGVILETFIENAIDRWASEAFDLVAIDIDTTHADRIEFLKKFREISVVPILLLLPAYHESQILEAYSAGIDDVIVKPISPAIFQAKIMAWVRRSWTMPIEGLDLVNAGQYWLDPKKRSIIIPNGLVIKLTNLEFQLLHLLMLQPGHEFTTDEIIQSIWGQYGDRNNVLLKNVVYRLRKKIEADPSQPVLLQTWLKGYSFQG
ncbi:MAG TPA: hypothetical protein DEH25_10550 [Chloroflexi bacterium]|nr:hypothetical protein [Chloroflexota bacterium]